MVKRLINPGEKYNSLTVINSVRVKDAHYWECKCDCGKLTRTFSNHLRTGRIKSCGCLQYKNPIKPKGSTNILGKQYGSYVVMARSADGKYLVKCECGTVLSLSAARLYTLTKCLCNKMGLNLRVAKVKKEILTKTLELRKIGLTKPQVIETLKNEYDLDVLKRVVSQSRISNSSNA